MPSSPNCGLPAGPQLLDEYPALAAYVVRGKDRPAYQRAFADQRQVFLDAAIPD